MIAVPGVATVNLLTQSIGTDGLTWSSTVQCNQASRDPRDNVASLFWPKLMEVRGLLERLEPADLQSATSYIKASLCDGEDEASPELKQALMETMTEDVNAVLNSGDVPNLYGAEEMDAITTACGPECVKKRIPKTKLNIFNQV